MNTLESPGFSRGEDVKWVFHASMANDAKLVTHREFLYLMDD